MDLNKTNIEVPEISEAITKQLNNCRSVILEDGEPKLIDGVAWQPKHSAGLLIETAVVGICQSDVKEVAGQREGGSQFGHEIVGTVIDKWGNIAFEIGDMVCYDPNISLNRGSGFSRLVPFDGEGELLEAAIYKVGEAIDARRLVFAEPLSCALHCVSNVTKYLNRDKLNGYSVGVVGAGNAGILIGMSASRLGAEVVMINRDRERLAFLDEMDFFAASSLKSIDESISALDIVIITATFITEELFQRSLELVKENGLIVLYGGTKARDGMVDMDIDLNTIRKHEQAISIVWNNKKIYIIGSYGTELKSYSTAISWLKDKSNNCMKLERLITKEIKLSELPDMLKAMTSTKSFGKVVVTFK